MLTVKSNYKKHFPILIIKILIIKIFLFGFSYTYAQIPTENLKLWYVGDSVVLDGSHVIEWTDYSGNNLHAIQTTSINRPIQTSKIYNLHSAVRFDGTNDYLITNFIESLEQPITVFIVWKKNETKQQTMFDGLSYNNRIAFSYPYGNIDLLSILAGGIGNGLQYTKPLTNNLTINSIFISSTSMVFDNGVLKATDINVGNNNTNGFTIGSHYDFTRFFNGDITEFIIYDTIISTEQRVNIENYLMQKYAPVLDLGEDIDVKYGFCDVVLKIDTSFTEILWSTGETTDSIIVNKSGKYWVKAVDIFGRTSYDTINVNLHYTHIPDTILCANDTIFVPSGLDHTYSFLWSNGGTDSVATVFTPGEWWVDITDSSPDLCSIRDSFIVVVDSFPVKATLGQDTSLCSGNSISLVSGAEPNINYLWSTGSTGSSTIVSSAGSYWVSATNKNNCVLKDTINVSIKGFKPTVAFAATTACQNELTSFTDMSFTQPPDNIATWQWNFDNQGFSVLQNPNFKFNSHGDYNVKLTVSSGNGCVGDTTIKVHVRSLPKADFSPFNGCSNKDIEFKDLSKIGEGALFSWQWIFGDGQTSNIQNPTHAYADTGLYTIKLIAQDIFGCKDSLEKIIKIRLSPKVTFDFNDGCVEQTIYFYETTNMPPWAKIINRKWEFGDGAYSWAKNPTHIYNSSGEYTITLKNFSINGCMDSTSKKIIIQKTPIADFSTGITCEGQFVQFKDQSFVENGNIVKWLWDFGNKYTDSISNPKIIYADTGKYNVKLSVSSEFGCKKTISKEIIIHPVTPNDFSFTPEYGIHPLNVQFINLSEGNLTHQWFFGDGTSSTEANPAHTFINENIYDVLLVSTNEFDCVDSAFGVVYVIPSKLDLMLTKMNVKDSLNSIYIDAHFFNNGTRNVRQIALDAKINNGLPLREVWDGLIKPGEYGYYKFVSSFPKVNESSIRMICLNISALDAFGQEDINLENNSACYTLSDDFFVEPVMPNPARESIYTDIAMPTSGNILASIISREGKEIWKENIDSEAGILRLKIDVSSFADGVYALRIQYKNKVESFKFVKISH